MIFVRIYKESLIYQNAIRYVQIKSEDAHFQGVIIAKYINNIWKFSPEPPGQFQHKASKEKGDSKYLK